MFATSRKQSAMPIGMVGSDMSDVRCAKQALQFSHPQSKQALLYNERFSLIGIYLGISPNDVDTNHLLMTKLLVCET